MMPAKPSFSAVNPAVGGGYATAGLEAEPTGPMKPLTSWPGPVLSRMISVGTSALWFAWRVASRHCRH